MTKRRTTRKTPQLKVVFDSNALYTGSASDLLNREVRLLIKEHSHHPDLTVTWYLPEIVLHERQYQMLRRGHGLLPPIQKLEKLLGHHLNITEAIIENRVKEAVKTQLNDYGIQPFSLAVDSVDWDQVMLDAVYRRPPFEPGDKEKGFRDTLVAETFLQIVSASPVTPKICRVVLVTGDKLLGDAVRSRTADYTNVRVLTTLEELKSLVNTLVAAVSEDFVAEIQEQVKRYFFELEEKGALYYKEDIHARIEQRFTKELVEVPSGADARENGTWYISAPRFIKKEHQRVFWVSRISVEAKAYRYIGTGSSLKLGTAHTGGSVLTGDLYGGGLQIPSSIQIGTEKSLGKLYDLSSQIEPQQAFSELYRLSDRSLSGLPRSQNKTLVADGKSVFEITWSVSVSTNKRLSASKIETIKFIETSWE